MNRIYKQIMNSYVFGISLSIFVLFIASILSFANGAKYTGLFELLFCVLLVFYVVFVKKTKKADMENYLKTVIDSQDGQELNGEIIHSFPLPMTVLRIDGQIMWYNDKFAAIFGDNLFDEPLESVISELKWSEILKYTNGIKTDIHYDGRHYEVSGEILRNSESVEETFNVILYFTDRTMQEKIEECYQNEKTDIAIISIDNYEEILQKLDDTQRQKALGEIDKYISEWVSISGGVRRKTDRDRYLVLFEHQYLKNYIDQKFDVIDKIRAVGEGARQPITISIGIGVGGKLYENEEYARAALDMVFGRGGDQAAIKDESQYQFYGGKTKEYEKSTRVKTRAVASALKDFIEHSDNVILMGHANADFDSFGAMIGLQRAVRTLGKVPYLIVDNFSGVQKLYQESKDIEEYEGMIIDTETATEVLTDNSLVIIVDTHRPSLVSCPVLLDGAPKLVLIDHHRRSTEFIKNCSLVYHEPYASSTCEMVTELLQYINDGKSMTTFEAKALYVGLLMDTKNFVMKTGVRTFEAASYLRKYGVDTILVKGLFDIDKEDYAHKVDIVKSAEFVGGSIAIAVCEEKFPNFRVISAQAADEMLEITGVEAAFVIYDEDGSAGISGRSLGDISVQLILEKLGGGGHMMVAGAKIKGIAIEQAKEMLISAINEYISEDTED